ncbi:MAG: bifunctional 5,10-methylenetetrahydrofolate dehydrogenase/5,10-methenyltetrahydrofolate cyclohydrolase [bacterium]|nr:bifunctional 5,10-methylenetetrahydrofolate dehydrogenase/5,10-methenyltetrahydrofolate cyclohydrolase [bacterium]
MIVSGKPIAQKILSEIQKEITEKKLHPHLSIILASNNDASRMYIKHKTIIGDEIGVKVSTFEFEESVPAQCIETIIALNKDILVNGIIVQLPLYPGWISDDYVTAVSPEKDVDGFLPGSPFIPATAEGTWEMLQEFARIEGFESAESFLKDKTIVVLGKGKTAGKPVRDLLEKKGFPSQLIDSKTDTPDRIIKTGDIVISATGKKHIINETNIKSGAYVIGIGVGREKIDGKTKTYGDVDEKSIEQIAKLICPTVGGIGPLTIACLLRNVYTAAQKTTALEIHS